MSCIAVLETKSSDFEPGLGARPEVGFDFLEMRVRNGNIAPKFKEGQEGIWLLREGSTSTKEKVFANDSTRA